MDENQEVVEKSKEELINEAPVAKKEITWKFC
jgi:hypothetical protein